VDTVALGGMVRCAQARPGRGAGDFQAKCFRENIRAGPSNATTKEEKKRCIANEKGRSDRLNGGRIKENLYQSGVLGGVCI